MTNLHLVCLKEPSEAVMSAIHRVFGEGACYELNDTQVVVVKSSNGGKSVYERIKESVGDDFVALIVRFKHFHGRHNSDLWQWLAGHVSG